MPYISEKIKLTEEQDRRVKLSAKQKEEVRELFKTGKYTQNYLAKLYNVSQSLVGILVNKERADKVRERVKTHWKDYSNREELTKAARNLRIYKQNLYLKGQLSKS